MAAANKRSDSGGLQQAVISLAAPEAIPDPGGLLPPLAVGPGTGKRLAFTVSHVATASAHGARIGWRDEAAGRPFVGRKGNAGAFEPIGESRALLTASFWDRLLTRWGQDDVARVFRLEHLPDGLA